MKLKICVLFLFAVACLVMEGCSAYDYTEHESTLDSAKVYSACWPAADSALLDFLADTAYSGMVVYGKDKLDEISMSAPTHVCEIKDGWFKSYTITPEQFGFERCTKDDLKGGTPAENAQITRELLGGAKGHKRNAVLLNAGASLYIGGKADSFEGGVKLAAEIIDSGKALETLEKLIEVSNA